VTITSTARALSQWVSRSQRGWLALGEAVVCDMSGSRLLFVGAEYASRKIAKSSRKVKLNVITAIREPVGVSLLAMASYQAINV
jgi:hypothetical protein